MANKTEFKNLENKISDSNAFVKKTDYNSEITKIKNDDVINATFTSQINDLKRQHIADEVKKVDDKVTKNSTDILHFDSRLKQKEDTLNYLERKSSFSTENYYYNQQSYFLSEPKSKSYDRNGEVINSWVSTRIHNDSKNTDLFSVKN